MQQIGFGGGCHWCTEAIFQALTGVEKVEQGWIASAAPFDAFSEAVVVHFDEEQIPLAVLVEIHLLTHSSAGRHRLRDKYRSAVYYFNPEDKMRAEAIIGRLAGETGVAYITQVLPFADFRLNQEAYLNYYQKDRQKPFCKTYIDPKLKALREKFARRMRPEF